MSSYDYEDGRSETASRFYEDRRQRDSRDARYVDGRDTYTKSQVTSRDLVPRTREDSDLSVEEIHREFPVPTYTRGAYREYEDDRRSRSHKDRGYDRSYDRGYDRDYEDDRREAKKGSRGTTFYGEERKRRRMLSNQEKIMAAIVGGAIAVGGKELYDRREARQDSHGVQRNALSSAALGAAGALAAYQGADFYNKHSAKEERKTLVVHKGRDSRGDLYSEDDSDLDDPYQKKGHKSFLESLLGATSLGAAAKALTGGDDRRSDDRRSESGRSRRSSRERDDGRSESRGGGTNKIQKAAMASLIAGATEAFRVAKEPGAWKGEKAKRVLTAAAGAATIDAATDEKHSKLGLAESVIGGLLGNRIVNGSRRNIEEDRRTGRSRSRSRARSDGGGASGGASGLAALATAGLAGLGAKKFADSRSQSRRRYSDDDYDDRDRDRDRSRRSRSRSVVDSARRGLSKLGIGNDDDAEDRKSSSRRHYRRQDSADSYDRRDRDHDYDRERDRGSGRSGGRDNYDDDARSTRSTRSTRSRRKKGGSRSDSESDLGSSSEDEKRAKKIKGKKVITTGLAAVATIHAAHSVYQSMEKRHARQKAVREGRLSEEEAKKLKNRALLQDAASVGIAALGINGAISELKEAREVHHELEEWKEEKERRHQRRLQRLQSQSTGPGRRRSENWSSPLPARPSRSDDGRVYTDRDSYGGAPPAPPVAYDSRQYDRAY